MKYFDIVPGLLLVVSLAVAGREFWCAIVFFLFLFAEFRCLLLWWIRKKVAGWLAASTSFSCLLLCEFIIMAYLAYFLLARSLSL